MPPQVRRCARSIPFPNLLLPASCSAKARPQEGGGGEHGQEGDGGEHGRGPLMPLQAPTGHLEGAVEAGPPCQPGQGMEAGKMAGPAGQHLEPAGEMAGPAEQRLEPASAGVGGGVGGKAAAAAAEQQVTDLPELSYEHSCISMFNMCRQVGGMRTGGHA